jgi:hypothetical protein
MTPTSIPQSSPSHLISCKFVWQDKYIRTYTCEMFYQRPSLMSITFLQLQTWADAMHTAFGGEIDDIMDHEAMLARVEVRYVDINNVDITANSTNAGIPGVMGDIIEDAGQELESLPPYATLNVRKITGYAGRQNRGRLFIPCISEQVQHDGILDTLNIAGAQEAISNLVNPPMLEGEALKPIHWNREEGIAVEILSLQIVNVLGTRRDRRYKMRPTTYNVPRV